MSRQTVYTIVLLGIAAACVGIFIYDEIIGRMIDDTVKSLILFITGVLTHELGGSQGASNALDGVQKGVNGAQPKASSFGPPSGTP